MHYGYSKENADPLQRLRVELYKSTVGALEFLLPEGNSKRRR